MTEDTYTTRAATPEGRRGLACAAARYRAVELIAEVLEGEGVSQRELASRLGRTESAVSQVLGGDRNLTLNTLSEYLDALDHRLEMHASRCVEGLHRVDLSDLVDVPEAVSYGSASAYEPYRVSPRPARGLA